MVERQVLAWLLMVVRVPFCLGWRLGKNGTLFYLASLDIRQE